MHKKTGTFGCLFFLNELNRLKDIPQTKLHLPTRNEVGAGGERTLLRRIKSKYRCTSCRKSVHSQGLVKAGSSCVLSYAPLTAQQISKVLDVDAKLDRTLFSAPG